MRKSLNFWLKNMDLGHIESRGKIFREIDLSKYNEYERKIINWFLENNGNLKNENLKYVKLFKYSKEIRDSNCDIWKNSTFYKFTFIENKLYVDYCPMVTEKEGIYEYDVLPNNED